MFYLSSAIMGNWKPVKMSVLDSLGTMILLSVRQVSLKSSTE